ncbi:LysE family translocator [Microlunatus capsulatus]|uniref:Threonine/homoserine/homoserine lactone efflux protein n=1 Tax=Microlunatus capsulatus TaxID=99117 RepID=A0ABS4Z561_9ACTN|nr:LysE family translocator [Microlunatus capsulatus]MBP2416182.1 threonine/homoserine/homoserine lactone efflux protein [Microlunatus capsulatus]
MPPAANLAAFVLAAALLIAVPGPSVLFVIGRSLAAGRRVGLLTVLGNALGMVPQVLAVAAGVGALLAQSVVAFTVLKTAGALYLVHLGVQAIRHRHRATAAAAATTGGTGSPAEVPASRALREGFLVGVSNPKSAVFFVAVLPQFTAPATGPVWSQILVLGLIHLLIGLAFDTVWALTAGAARGWLTRDPRRLPRLGATGGVMMIGVGVTIALTDRQL